MYSMNTPIFILIYNDLQLKNDNICDTKQITKDKAAYTMETSATPTTFIFIASII